MAVLGAVLVIPQLGIAQSESLLCAGRAATVVGTEGNDTLHGTDGPDVIVAKGGDDSIIGGAGDDVICANDGNDSVWAGGGSDIVFGGSGTDHISGDAGSDECHPMGGDVVSCESGTTGDEVDTVVSTAAAPTPEPVESTDGPVCEGLAATIVGTTGSDTLRGTPGDDVIVALDGNDRIIAGGGDDVVCAGAGNDSIWGGGGADALFGGTGSDTITGDDGRDRCTVDGSLLSGCEVDADTGVDISGDVELETDEFLSTALSDQVLSESASAGTTGVRAGTELTVHRGELVITTNGAVFENKDIIGCVKVFADNVTIRNSRITCEDANAAVWQGSSFGGLLVEDSIIRGIGSMSGSGVFSQAPMTVRRTEISNVVDGMFVYGDSLIEGNWIHGLVETASSHNDLIQMVKGERVVIRNNLLEHERGQTSAIMIKSDHGPIDDLVIDNNVMSGGSFSLYVYAGNALAGGCCGPPTNVRVTNNTVIADSYLYGAMSIQGDATVTCNTDQFDRPVTYFADDRMRSPQVSAC